MNNITDILSTKKMDFPEAMRQVINGKKVTKLEWKNNNYYGFLNGQWLMIHKPDGKLYVWKVNDGDMLGTDWVVI
jgi:hypothetical protein